MRNQSNFNVVYSLKNLDFSKFDLKVYLIQLIWNISEKRVDFQNFRNIWVKVKYLGPNLNINLVRDILRYFTKQIFRHWRDSNRGCKIADKESYSVIPYYFAKFGWRSPENNGFDMPNGKNYQKKFKKFSYFLVNFYFFMPCP